MFFNVFNTCFFVEKTIAFIFYIHVFLSIETFYLIHFDEENLSYGVQFLANLYFIYIINLNYYKLFLNRNGSVTYLFKRFGVCTIIFGSKRPSLPHYFKDLDNFPDVLFKRSSYHTIVKAEGLWFLSPHRSLLASSNLIGHSLENLRKFYVHYYAGGQS